MIDDSQELVGKRLLLASVLGAGGIGGVVQGMQSWIALSLLALLAVPAPAPAAEPKVAPAVTAALCKGRSVLVFEDEQINQLAMDGMIANIELHTAGASDDEFAKKLVGGLKASGCAVTHWEEPLVSVSVVDGKRTAFFGEDKKEENYKPTHKLKGNELDTHDVVVWIKRAAIEKTKTRRGEGLRIDYTFEAQLQARQQKKVELDANWQYAQDDLSEYSSYGDEEEARKRALEKFAPRLKEQHQAFDAAVHQALKAALEGLPPATP